jgi:hypothetical protein
MDKQTFDAFEAICKASWRVLSKTGGEKPSYLSGFDGECPACHISSIEREDENCLNCPIDVWRQASMCSSIRYAYCCGDLYGEWLDATTDRQRKKVAAQIAELKWTFLPFHKKLKI